MSDETSFWTAPEEVGDLAMEVMREHHPLLVTADVRIAFLFREPPKESGGKVELAHTRKVPEHLRTLSGGHDFVTVMAAGPWDDMTDARRRALLDHELSHICVTEKKDGTWKLSIRKHDVGDFKAVIERHGFWMEGRDFTEMVQRVLFGEPKAAKPQKSKAPAQDAAEAAG